ncbi:MAG: 23S rRNA (uracil-C(5))-methyltransferase RlmCD [Chlamydiia bacterium]|nr:23S rRNA (uracil-C(5))-methyltransferase RlmCD [Chlamydiia bacterium]MCH9614942.1 23S rRNA (uracil-C(5))-methyltransferase RlmCD [Chlamydiia bacterium]MCH9630007.1 23S rRNA (uracil-C(5))-methyltransferase RlmCD [Chlamydiia bacterium]
MEVKIDSYSKRGHGKVAGKRKLEIPRSIIGEDLEIDKRGKLLQILRPSQDRVKPRCKHYFECGGCAFQHLDYSAQLKVKQDKIDALFGSSEPIIGCKNPWHYRNKMEFSFSENKAGEKFLGLFIARSRGWVLNVNECHLTSSFFTDSLEAVRKWWHQTALKAFHPPSGTGTLRTLTLREGIRTGERMAILTVNSDEAPSHPDLNSFKALFSEGTAVFLRIHQAIKGQPTQFFEMQLAGPAYIHEELYIQDKRYRFAISPEAFFQPNSLQAEILYTKALEIVNPQKEWIVYDLYCGTATLGILFAPHVNKVTSVELSKYAVFDAKQNLELNKTNNVEVLQGDVGQVLGDLKGDPDLVIVDPPRSGLGPLAIEHLKTLKPPRILYISCNPKTQKEDIENLGYQVKTVQSVDQFPHTPHIENIALLIP